MNTNEVAREIFRFAGRCIPTYSPGTGPSNAANDLKRTWIHSIDADQADQIFTLHINAGNQDLPHGVFLDYLDGHPAFGDLVTWHVTKDDYTINFTIHGGGNPVKNMNWVLDQAADEAKSKTGNFLISSMLTDLTVIGVTLETMTLTLLPKSTMLWASMVKREGDILAAIKAVCPEVNDVTIISGEQDRG